MGVFDYAALSATDIGEACQIASAASKGEPVPGDGWVALGAKDLNFRASRTNGSFDGHYFNAGSATPGGSAIVLRNGGQLAVAFRGTDDPIDYLSYTKLANGTYLDGFNSFLTCVATYAKANKITDVLVTGHSLGAGAANILRDCPPDKSGGVFHNADYVTFAPPKVAASGDILNIGFENDSVFKILNKKDFSSTTDNIVVYDDEYANSPDSNDRTVHGKSTTQGAVDRIISSSFYNEMNRDSVVIVVQTDRQVSDKQTATSDHAGQPAYFIGRGAFADNILGGANADAMEGLGGNDILKGQGGNDRLLGGRGDDQLAGGTEDDVLDGEADNDWIFGGLGDDRLLGGSGEGADGLFGEEGADDLRGGLGDDVLSGGAGRDVLRGQGGADIFDFDDATDFGVGAARDVISDFATGDRIDLRDVDADQAAPGDQAFRFIGSGSFSGISGELRVFQVTNAAGAVNTIVEADTNGDGTGDIQIQLSGGMALSEGDLLL